MDEGVTMKHHRVLAAVAAAGVAALALAGCSSGGSTSPSGKQTLTIEDYYDAAHDPIYATCAKTVGVETKIQHVAGAGLIAKVLQQVSSRTLPDVLMLDNPDVQQIAASGALTSLSDYGLDATGDPASVTAAGTYKGKLVGLAPAINSIALYYNTDLLKKANVAPPKTWDELRAAAKKLTVGKQYGFAMSNINTYEGSWQFLPFFWTNGGDEKNIDTPEAAQALQFVVDLQNDGSMSKSSINWAQADVNSQFIARKAAMMINGPWQLPALTAAKGLHFASVPIPTRDSSQVSTSPLGGEAYTVPNTGNTTTQALAGKFVKCLNSPSVQTQTAKVTGNIPSNESVADKWGASHPDVQSFVTVVKTARARTGELGPDWPKAATKIYTAVQLALTGKASPADALKQAQSQSQ
jgi:multiple sugar transport system substrate-binding protein